MRAGILVWIGTWTAFVACGGTGGQTRPEPPKTTNAVVKSGLAVLLENNPLAGKKIAVVCNHTARISGVHLVDTLSALGVKIQAVYAPEHGFRGEAEAGQAVKDGKDPQTGVPVVSLYGERHGPDPAEIAGLDHVVFDVQDVGARFYTYLSTLTYVMDACARAGTEIIVLDRPNPNGFFADGPVMKKEYKSFVGMHPVPMIHGMTVGEYATMVNEEGWLKAGKKAQLRVVSMQNYRHEMRWNETQWDWIAPSPNLPTPESAELYPVLCWYEGTNASVGRGTETPFSVVGFPTSRVFKDTVLGALTLKSVAFTPRSIPGKAANPLHKDLVCRGYSLTFAPQSTGNHRLVAGLELLKLLYQSYDGNAPFFNSFFEKLVGDDQLRKDVVAGKPAVEIWQSWQNEVEIFKTVRQKYLLYP